MNRKHVFAFLCISGLLLSVALAACGGGGGGETGIVIVAQDSFNGADAFQDLIDIVALGPRIPGSQASADTRAMIIAELNLLGIQILQFPFTANTPNGPVQMVNIVGVVQGTLPGTIMLSNHYDTKIFQNFTFVGANDAGSSTAWMLEMARTLGSTRTGHTVWLTWFDGEEAVNIWSPTDSLYGSREMVRELTDTNQLSDIKALVNMDMIGDCLLVINRDALGTSWIQNIIWDSAIQLGYTANFSAIPMAIQDDHLPFVQAGVSAANLIDFRYGGTITDHNMNWHTANDTINLLCQESLDIVGEVMLHALPRIDDEIVATP